MQEFISSFYRDQQYRLWLNSQYNLWEMRGSFIAVMMFSYCAFCIRRVWDKFQGIYVSQTGPDVKLEGDWILQALCTSKRDHFSELRNSSSQLHPYF